MTDTALATVVMIARLREQGATWAQIAPAIGAADAKSAKAMAKQLARRAQSAAVREAVQHG